MDPSSLPMSAYGPIAITSLNPAAVGASGGSQPHNNVQPFLCINFIIALEGIYPTRE